MALSNKPEYPPLLPCGFHRLHWGDLRRTCVDPFPLSNSRALILRNLETVCCQLVHHGLFGDLWIDGSFMTAKLDPEDVDVVLCAASTTVDSLDDAGYAYLARFANSEFRDLGCHTFAFTLYPAEHPNHRVGLRWFSYWKQLWGHSRGGHAKGIGALDIRAFRLLNNGAQRHPLRPPRRLQAEFRLVARGG